MAELGPGRVGMGSGEEFLLGAVQVRPALTHQRAREHARARMCENVPPHLGDRRLLPPSKAHPLRNPRPGADQFQKKKGGILICRNRKVQS